MNASWAARVTRGAGSVTSLISVHELLAQRRHPLEAGIARDHHGVGAKLKATEGLQAIGCPQVVLDPQQRGPLHHSRAELHPLQIREQARVGACYAVPAEGDLVAANT